MPYGIIFATIIIFLLFFMEKEKKKSRGARGYTLYWLFFIYLVVVVIQTFFSREAGSRTGIDLGLFATWGSDSQSRAYVIENIVMCIPLGIFLPLLSKRFRKTWKMIGSGLLFSLSVETMQLITQRGYFQIDDVVTNILGTVIGFLCWKFVQRITAGIDW